MKQTIRGPVTSPRFPIQHLGKPPGRRLEIQWPPPCRPLLTLDTGWGPAEDWRWGKPLDFTIIQWLPQGAGPRTLDYGRGPDTHWIGGGHWIVLRIRWAR